MIDTTTSTELVTCSTPSPFNKFGNKLIAAITPEGVLAWCKYCRQPHLISREQLEQAWKDMKQTISVAHVSLPQE